MPAPKAGSVVTSVVPTERPASQYADEGVVVQEIDIHYTYQDDGTGTMVKHARVRVQDEAGAKAFSVLSLAYASASQTAKIVNVTVTHPDGTKVETPASDVMNLPARVTQEAPLYSDVKVLQVPVRGLRPGDTLEYTMRVEMTKAQDPGEFWGEEQFLKSLVVLKGSVILNVPADKYVQVWSPGLKPEVSEVNGRKVYRWTYSQLKPTQELNKKKTVTTNNIKPSVAWTTFQNWQAVGEWYRELAETRLAPTAAIVAKANEITANAKTPEEQAREIYDFVSTHIRYIGVDFGVGRYQPHSPEVVLANQYGDCKDKDTLLEALLRAKGFETAPALIGVGLKMITELPMPALFNHVITTVTIGGKQVWLDSTPEVAPFQMLISQIRGKRALVIPEKGVAELERTPAKPPFPLEDRMDATAKLTADGDLKAHMVVVDRSDAELLLREVARNVAPAQWDQAVQYLSRLMGFGGTVSNSQFEHVEDLDVPIRLTYDYDHPKFGDWSDLRILPLFPLVGLPPVPDKQPATAIELGAERTELAQTVIHLPAGFTPDLPDPVHVKTDFATYDRTYGFANGVLTADRKVVVLQSKIAAKDWKAYQKFANDTSLLNYTYIQLLTHGKGSDASGTSSASGSETAHQMIAQANGLELANDLAGALKLLDKLKAMAPKQPYLWSNYGWVAMRQNKLSEALKDFERELKYHPDESYVQYLYAIALKADGQPAKAISVLKATVAKNPSDVAAALVLAPMEGKTDLPGAIAMLEKVQTAVPGNDVITEDLAGLLIRNHQSDKAIPLLEKGLKAARDEVALNNESYDLAMTGADLPLAEQKEREALRQLDEQTSQMQVTGANPEAFVRASLLASDWDTLGYILMKEGKLAEARSYLAAAWVNEQDLTVGLHYGMVLERMGQKAQAMRIYHLAEGQKPDELVASSPTAQESAQLKEAIAHLDKEKVRSTGEDATIALQRMRTFHLEAAVLPKTFEQATFRLEFSAEGPPQVMQVNGDAAMAQFVTRIAGVDFPKMVPAGSNARLLRDAVMSCSPGDRDCVLVLLPMGPMQAEQATVLH
jgi:predicted Zn-dependent protease